MASVNPIQRVNNTMSEVLGGNSIKFPLLPRRGLSTR